MSVWHELQEVLAYQPPPADLAAGSELAFRYWPQGAKIAFLVLFSIVIGALVVGEIWSFNAGLLAWGVTLVVAFVAGIPLALLLWYPPRKRQASFART